MSSVIANAIVANRLVQFYKLIMFHTRDCNDLSVHTISIHSSVAWLFRLEGEWGGNISWMFVSRAANDL